MADVEQSLTEKLTTVLSDLKEVMEQRKTRIEELRQEIARIENENDDLEKQIQELINGF